MFGYSTNWNYMTINTGVRVKMNAKLIIWAAVNSPWPTLSAKHACELCFFITWSPSFKVSDMIMKR
jgi:hypothetical protein